MKRLLSLLMAVFCIVGTGSLYAEGIDEGVSGDFPTLSLNSTSLLGNSGIEPGSFMESVNGFVNKLGNEKFWHDSWTKVNDITAVAGQKASEAMQVAHGMCNDMCNDGWDLFNRWDKRATLYKYVDIVRHNREIIISSLIACYAAVSGYSFYSCRSAEVKPLVVIDRFDHKSLEEVCYIGDFPAQAQSFVSLIEHSGELNKLGVKAEKMLLITGKSGIGKTALARAIAQKIACPLITVDMYKVRKYPVSRVNSYFIGKLQSQLDRVIDACAQEPVIVLIDDGAYCDPVWWTCINSLIKKKNVFVIVTDSEFCILSSELFDYHEIMQAPSAQVREDLLQYYADRIDIDFCVDWQSIALRTEGFLPLQLKNLVKKAVVAAVQDDSQEVYLEHFVQAGIYELVNEYIVAETEVMVNEQELVHQVADYSNSIQEVPEALDVGSVTENQEVGDVHQQPVQQDVQSEGQQQDVQSEGQQQDVQKQEPVNLLADTIEPKEVVLTSNDDTVQSEVVVNPELLVVADDTIEQVTTRSIESSSHQEVIQEDSSGMQESLNQVDEPFLMIDFVSA